MISSLLIFAFAPAFAQDGYDAHGFTLAPGAGDTRDGLGVYNATQNESGSFNAQGVLEYADDVFILKSENLSTGEQSSETLLGNLIGMNLGGYYALNERVAVTGTMPVWFRSSGNGGAGGFATGDIRLAVPVSVLMRDPTELGVGVALVPSLKLPSGNNGRYLGDDGVGAGGLAAVTLGDSRWNISTNAGIEWRALVGEDMAQYGLRGGLFGVGGVAAGVDVMENLGLVGELRGAVPLGEDDSRLMEAPLEASLSARALSEKGIGLQAGVSKGISHGAGSAEWRAFAGVSYSGGGRGDVLSPVVQARPDAELLVTVVDPAGAPIPGARIALDGYQQVADMAGRAKFEELDPGDKLPIDVAAQTWMPAHDSVTLAEGENTRVIVLDPEDGTLKVIALDEHGAPIDARVRFLAGPEDQAMANLGPDGEQTFRLASGDWKVLVATDRHVPEERSVTLPQAGHESIYVQFSGEARNPVCTQNVTLHNVNFDFDIDVPRPEATPVLEALARTLKDCPDITLEVGGHTDWIGTDAYNVDLSQRRMNSVKGILVSYGVPAEQLIAVGYGESVPVAPNATDAGRAQNRRVEFNHIDNVSADANN